jgi:NADPH-dependent 2,4-dienoyl-CoA reductase/sulfur reductase-like enzyme
MDGKMKTERSLVIIGGGPAGLAAAIEARKQGIKDILLLERASQLGGILPQCIHDGFGLKLFKKQYTGPQYATVFIRELKEQEIEYATDAIVLEITADKEIHYMTCSGYHCVTAKAIILAMGCRERTRGNILIPGTRPAGIMTAGTAQHYINIMGYLPGKRVVILGSGDIGLIMARRLTLEGAKVLAVVEIKPAPSGLRRNVIQCLEDYDIPLFLSHTVTDIKGKNRVSGVTVSKVDDNCSRISGTDMHFDCDTLLLSVGLIPENELSKQVSIELSSDTNGPVVSNNMQTNIDGFFACGNVLDVHDLVDYVTMGARCAGAGAAEYIKDGLNSITPINVKPLTNIRYVVPQTISTSTYNSNLAFCFRTTESFKDVNIVIRRDHEIIKEIKGQNITAGEMERIPISLELFNLMLGGKEITVELKEDCVKE